MSDMLEIDKQDIINLMVEAQLQQLTLRRAELSTAVQSYLAASRAAGQRFLESLALRYRARYGDRIAALVRAYEALYPTSTPLRWRPIFESEDPVMVYRFEHLWSRAAYRRQWMPAETSKERLVGTGVVEACAQILQTKAPSQAGVDDTEDDINDMHIHELTDLLPQWKAPLDAFEAEQLVEARLNDSAIQEARAEITKLDKVIEDVPTIERKVRAAMLHRVVGLTGVPDALKQLLDSPLDLNGPFLLKDEQA